MSSLFGSGSGAAAGGTSSSNQAYGPLSGALSGNIGNVGAAGGQLASLLGLNGGAAQNQGFTNWRNSTGYQFGLNQGMESINGNAATQGLLNSGGNEKALQTYGQNYANTQYGNYTSQLQNLLNSGNQSAGVLAGAGQKSTSTNDMFGQGGVPSGIGQLLSKGASL
jgi:hypothetical protein